MDFYRKHVKSDCESLLGRFQQTQSVRFEVFSNIWKEMKFVQIFSGKPTHKKRAFCRLVLDIAYCYFLPPFSFQIRVGGLYLLYSFYHCQTASTSEQLQIRVALKDWEDVKNFEKDAMDAQHLDVVYILKQLMICKAFQFTAMPTLLLYRTKRNEEKPMLCEQFIERASCPQELINTQLLEEMSNIYELYKNMKTNIISQITAPTNTSVNLIRKDIVSQLCSTVMEFYNWQQGRDIFDEHKNIYERTSSQQECSNRAMLLASIKSKAYGEASEASKSRRHRQVETNLTTQEDGSFLKERHSRVMKQSLRNRTDKQIHMLVWVRKP
ncbi:snRNA-activating protein complex subunit 1-like isoform X2 [Girardinichthys multiradiatus]|uniref:snRNA-activating protein complex subunit 1-like isoform X2 n=1 Tax=Girardinichthys multiradiatus TaxID=208333 RepID=UPI001FADD93B|nr:snRNA-activating protein complex subunit 1-like isoform X2 [Girardinichthys multiradiatus]